MFFRVLLAALALFLCLPNISLSQNGSPSISDKTHTRRTKWLEENAFPLHTRDIGAKGFDDLAALKEKIGDARNVLLGEGSHGHGATFEMKGRLIRFLHEEMGFNVLAWESGFFGCWRMDQAFQAQDVPLQTAVDLGVFPVFGWPEQNRPLFEYLWNRRSSDNPMIQAGFDCQFSSPDSFPAFPDWVEQFFLDAAGVALDRYTMSDFRQKMMEYHSRRGEEAYLRATIAHADAFITLFEARQHVIESNVSRLEALRARRLLENFKQLFEMLLIRLTAPENPAGSTNIRDKAMAETLIVIADEFYPKEKIVVWAHNAHISRNLSSVDSGVEGGRWDTYEPYVYMGDWLHEHFGDEMYAIGALMYEGPSNFATIIGDPFLYPPAVEGSIAWYFHRIGWGYGILDMKSLRKKKWLRRNQKARIHAAATATGKWPNVYDAFLYVEQQAPCTPVEEHR